LLCPADAFLLIVLGRLDAQSTITVRGCVLDGHQVYGPIVRAVDAEVIDLALVTGNNPTPFGLPAGCPERLGTEVDGPMTELPGLTLNSKKPPIFFYDQIISPDLHPWKQDDSSCCD
jgi:hypothetical protein